MDDDGSTWTLYDAGPRTVCCPLLFLPPVSGRADVFFRQILALSSLGYRVISVRLFRIRLFCRRAAQHIDTRNDNSEQADSITEKKTKALTYLLTYLLKETALMGTCK